jgi:hypothetical protein
MWDGNTSATRQQHVSNTRHQNCKKFSKPYSFLYKTAHMCFSLLTMLTSYNPATVCQILNTPSALSTSADAVFLSSAADTQPSPLRSTVPLPKTLQRHASMFPTKPTFRVRLFTSHSCLRTQVKLRDSNDRVTLSVTHSSTHSRRYYYYRTNLKVQSPAECVYWLS